MAERDDELSEIMAGVEALMRGDPVIAPLDQKVSSKIVEDITEGEKQSFFRRFITANIITVGFDIEPKELAPVVKVNFQQFKWNRYRILRADRAPGLAELVNSFTLEDLIENVVQLIDGMEHSLADFEHSSFEYRDIERKIRRLDILQKAAHIASRL